MERLFNRFANLAAQAAGSPRWAGSGPEVRLSEDWLKRAKAVG